MNAPLTLTNRQRLLAPIISAAIVAVAFVPVIVAVGFDDVDPVRYGLGISIVLLAWVLLVRSAFRAAFEITLDPTARRIRVRKLLRTLSYDFEDVRSWTFFHPLNMPPSRVPPHPNGLVLIKLADKTKYRGEVTKAQADQIAAMLPQAT
jgi:hypothetical protein